VRLLSLLHCPQGLYREDERDGPGLFSDTDAGRDDVGFWSRQHLVKLCVPLPAAAVFVVGHHWPLTLDPSEHRVRVQACSTHAHPSPPSVDCSHPVDIRLPAESLAVDRQAFQTAFNAVVDDRSPSWRQQLRQICAGLCIVSIELTR